MKLMDGDMALIKELLENQISNIHEKIETSNKNLVDRMDSNNRNIMTELSYIKKQTEKTNGRVTRNEDSIRRLFEGDNPIDVEVKQEIHAINNRISKIDDDNFIIKIITKYPKQAIFLIAFTVIILLAGSTLTILKFHNLIATMKQTEQVIKQDDGVH